MIIINLLIWCYLSFVVCISADEICSTKGQKGNCILLRNCPSLFKLFHKGRTQSDNEKLKKAECGQSKVCCEDQVSASEDQVAASLTPISKFLPTYKQCGIDFGNFKIKGGEETGLKEFPWMAMLIYLLDNCTNKTRNCEVTSCGGVLISKRYVLTAAHCFQMHWKKLVKVRLGEHDTTQPIDCIKNQGCNNPPVEIQIEKIIAHPKYNATDIDQQNDIALIRLAANVEFSDFIQPICIPNTNKEIKIGGKLSPMWASGWGATETGPYSKKKLKLKLMHQDTTMCQKKFGNMRKISDRIQFCAGGEKGKDTCNRDSGGPIMCPYGIEKDVKWFTTGIVSYGPDPCGQEGKPAVYTRVNAYTDWIIDNLKE
ncbi:phenoloxidase-activating factor 3-like [Chrysoperla carnea]|uniref:phenoloxidase-activating factor 3-like n=1 Tax=Chrysoperla carnea TaxID=189513 RepID=UPI001D096EFA|nr:phenoloxidase-activating factor 3-like [Chrysoperla carnea]